MRGHLVPRRCVRSKDVDVLPRSAFQYGAHVSTNPLFTRLVDDAAMFPPGNATPDDALKEHLEYRRAWFSPMIGPLLVPAGRWEEFCRVHADAGSPGLEVAIIGMAHRPVRVPPAVRISGYEVPALAEGLPSVPSGSRVAVEVRADRAGLALLSEIARRRAAGAMLVGKFRTGGTSAEAFPSGAALASFLAAALDAGTPVKLTAGLHHAVRFTDSATRFEHHGFLNVLVAVARGAQGGGREEMVAALEVRDPEVLVAEVRGLGAATVDAVRSGFLSFGCCGVQDPVDDLVSLGLIDKE